jgi:hypothetical protein
MIEICRDHAVNVKRWQDGQMALRWVAAGMGEALKYFRRVNGHYTWPLSGPPGRHHRRHTDQGGCRLTTVGPRQNSTAAGTTSNPSRHVIASCGCS